MVVDHDDDALRGHAAGTVFDSVRGGERGRQQTQLTYALGRLAMTTGHLGLLLLFCRSGYLSWLRNSLAAVGRMAFTHYISHSLIGAVLFSGFGFGMSGKLERHQLYYVVFSIWLRHYLFGPLEWGWRSLKKQPFRLHPVVAELTPSVAVSNG